MRSILESMWPFTFLLLISVNVIRAVYSATSWLMPFLLGTKIIAVGQLGAIIFTSWTAPEGTHLLEGGCSDTFK